MDDAERIARLQPELLCHLPFLRLPAATNEPLSGGGRLAPLPCEEWLALEDPMMEYHDHRYAKVEPAFVRAPLPEGDGIGELSNVQEHAVQEIIERSHTAAILALPRLAIAPPALSVSYVVWRGLPCDPPREGGWFGPSIREPAELPDDEGIQLGRIVFWIQQTPPGGGDKEQWVVERRFGPAQREWLLSSYARESEALSDEQVKAFAFQYSRLDRARWGPRRAAAVRCADVITIMTTRGVPTHEVIVLAVAALENVVNSAAEKPLGTTFARRCAAWFAETPEERDRDQPLFRRLYGARSAILHGGDPAESVRNLMAEVGVSAEWELVAWLRLHASLAVDYLIGWYGRQVEDDGGLKEFQSALAELASAGADSWQARRAELVEGRSYARS